MEQLLRKKDVCQLVGLSVSTIRRLEIEGVFPKRRQIGNGRAVRWLASEVEEFMKTRSQKALI